MRTKNVPLTIDNGVSLSERKLYISIPIKSRHFESFYSGITTGKTHRKNSSR